MCYKDNYPVCKYFFASLFESLWLFGARSTLKNHQKWQNKLAKNEEKPCPTCSQPIITQSHHFQNPRKHYAQWARKLKKFRAKNA